MSTRVLVIAYEETGGMATYAYDGYSLDTIHEACWLIFGILGGHVEIGLQLNFDGCAPLSSMRAYSQ